MHLSWFVVILRNRRFFIRRRDAEAEVDRNGAKSTAFSSFEVLHFRICLVLGSLSFPLPGGPGGQ
jgi:hypothetical protein